MAYNITSTDGTPRATVLDGQVDETSTSLTLIGKNYPGYGKFLNENFVQILENFSHPTESPRMPLEGQLWWNSTSKVLHAWSGSGWKVVSGANPSSTQPNNPKTGDLWWDMTSSKLNVYTGSQWTIIGPAFSSGDGIDSVLIEEAGGAQQHPGIKFTIGGTVVAILSKDPSSYTVSSYPGFSMISPGLNLSSTNSLGYYGITDNSNKLGGVLASKYLRTDVNGTLEGTLAITSNDGLTVGANSNFTIQASGTDTKLISKINGRDLGLYANVGGSQTKLIWLDGTNGRANAQATQATDTTTTIATKGYVDYLTSGAGSGALLRDGGNQISGSILPQTTNSYDFGSSAAKFANIYATNFNGLASDSSKLSNVAATYYARLDNATYSAFTVPVSISSNSGITIGSTNDFKVQVSINAVTLSSEVTNKSLVLSAKVGGVVTNMITLDGTSGKAKAITPVSGDDGLTIATKAYVDNVSSGAINLGSLTTHIIPAVGSGNTYDIGTNTTKWRTVYATTFSGQASTALYADLAERFSADAVYTPGTVLTIGGTAEVTMEMRDSSESVLGVVSSNPAYLMNAEVGDNQTHPAVALSGRVPVRVIGPVKKGNRLVSAGNGLARAAEMAELTAFNVIGRALESNDSANEKLVDAIVKINI